jgi:hypothetical protein
MASGTGFPGGRVGAEHGRPQLGRPHAPVCRAGQPIVVIQPDGPIDRRTGGFCDAGRVATEPPLWKPFTLLAVVIVVVGLVLVVTGAAIPGAAALLSGMVLSGTLLFLRKIRADDERMRANHPRQ